MMPFPPTRFHLVLRFLSLVLVFASPVAAHNGEGISLPPPPVNVRLDEGHPPRWSWIHWWEANRFKYLDTPNQTPPDQKPTTSEFVKLREQVSLELIESLKTAKRENLIIECALALGKLQHEPALPVLQALIESSPSPKVQTAALVAIGLIGTPGAERILISFNPPKKEGRIAALAAIGLLPQLQGETLQQLRKAVLTEDPAVATVICWALRQHPHPENNQYFSDLLRTHKSPWVASEALLALGETHDRNKVRLLGDVLRGYATVDMEVLAWGELSRLRNSMSAKALTPQQAASNANAANALSPNTPGQKVYLQTGFELIRLSWLRASAVIALGRLDQPEAATPLGQFLEPPPAEDEFLIMPREFALMAQAQYPSDRARIRAMMILGNKVDGKVQLETPKDSPIRGFAALALGLFARPYDTD